MGLFKLKANLYLLLKKQAQLRSIAARQCELFTARHNAITEEINAVDEEIRWAIFIEYCNTSCWRYKC